MGVLKSLFSGSIHSPRGHRGDIAIQQTRYSEEEEQEPISLRSGQTTPDGGKFEPEREPPDLGEFIANQYVDDYGHGDQGIDSSTGYLLPNGYGVRMGPGERYEDHRGAIPSTEAQRRWGWPEEVSQRMDEGNRHMALMELMRRSQAVRVHAGQGQLVLHFAHEPTHAQRREIAQHVKDYRPDTVIVSREGGREIELSNPYSGHVTGAIDESAVPEESSQDSRYSRQETPYVRKKPPQAPRGSANLAALLSAARSDPYNTNLHGAIADALDEEHSGSPIPDLIRSEYGHGPYAGQGEKSREWYDPFNNSWDGSFPYTARLGQHGPFSLFLGHEGGHEQGQNQRWIVHAISDLPGSTDAGYTWEIPHEEAHTIPKMFPAAKKHIASNPVGWTDQDHNLQAQQFDNQMRREEDARTDFDPR